MIGLFGLFGSWLRKLVVLLLLLGVLLGLGYYRYAMGRLSDEANVVRHGGICRATPSLSGGTVPLTFEVYEKRTDAHNWLLEPHGFGLVSRRLEWSHARFEWVEDVDFAERQAEAVIERRRHAEGDPGALIERLASDDAVVREIAAKELQRRTGQRFGYRYDAPAEERAQAIARWRQWWKDPDNRARYGAKRVGEVVQQGKEAYEKGKAVVDEALELLRRATGGQQGGVGGQ